MKSNSHRCSLPIKSHCFLLLLSVIFAGINFPATSEASGKDLRFDHVQTQDIDRIFSGFAGKPVPGCAVGVVSDGNLIYFGGYGMANLDYGIPFHPGSRFMIASLSKQFSAAALYMLEQEGKIDLDEDIRKYIPEIPAFGKPITARQLIHHSSGLRDIYNLLILADTGLDNTTTNEQAIELLSRQKRLNFDPGSEYLYSNSGYFLISVLIKNLSGMTLREYTHKHFFEPLGMHDTHWHDNTEEIVPNRVISYRPMEFGPGQFYRGNMDRVGARGLFTTMEDFAKWEANFIENRSNLDHFTSKMVRPGYTNRKSLINYGGGLRLHSYKNIRTIGHAGSYMGFRTNFLRFPTYNFTVIVFCNMSDIDPVVYTRQIADLYLKNIFDQQLREYTAIYRNESLQTSFEITGKDGDLCIRRILDNLTAEALSEEGQLLVWQRKDRFRFNRWILDFERDSAGRIDRFVLEAPQTGKITFYRERG